MALIEDNTISISFDCRPKTWNAIQLTLAELVQETPDAMTATQTELCNVVNQIRSSLQHYIVDEMQAAKRDDDWL